VTPVATGLSPPAGAKEKTTEANFGLRIGGGTAEDAESAESGGITTKGTKDEPIPDIGVQISD
jgi:hypothetical protein